MKLAYEKEMLGIYVSDHPLREIADEVRRASDFSLGTVEVLKDGTTGWFAGMLSSVALKPTKKGPMMAIVTLEDLDGSIEAVLFPQTLEKCRDVVKVDAVVRLRAKLEDSDRGKKLIVSEFEPFDGSCVLKASREAHDPDRCGCVGQRPQGEARPDPAAVPRPRLR